MNLKRFWREEKIEESKTDAEVEENDPKSEHSENNIDSEKEEEAYNIRERKQKSREQKGDYDNILSKHDMRKFRRRKTNLVQSEKPYLDEIQDWIKFYSKNSKTNQI